MQVALHITFDTLKEKFIKVELKRKDATYYKNLLNIDGMSLNVNEGRSIAIA